MKEGRTTFDSRAGLLLATAGSAVGLGNIWRFPYMLGTNGGGAFLLVYLACILLLGLPVMITEFFIGRHAQRNAVGALKKLAPNTHWSLIGFNGVLAALLILGFYFVIAGWTFEYMFQSLTTPLEGKTPAYFEETFNQFSSHTFRPIFWTFLFIAASHLIVISGVKQGIERASKLMMPFLFLILICLSINALMLSGAKEGLTFLFYPDFTKITSSVILSAMGQAFFSLSVGMGCLITYSSYFSKKTNLQRTAIEVVLLDTLIALLAGIMIFPAVFHFSIAPTAGVELVFITLPNIFAQLPFGNALSFLFYLLLAIAAISSTISLHEVVTAYIHEEFCVTRKKATQYVSFLAAFLAIFSSLSFGMLKDFTIFGLTFFELLDYLTAKIMLPLGGMMISIFVGNRVKKKILKKELTNEGTIPFYFFNGYYFFLRYVTPLAIGAVFLHELGLLDLLKSLF